MNWSETLRCPCYNTNLFVCLPFNDTQNKFIFWQNITNITWVLCFKRKWLFMLADNLNLSKRKFKKKNSTTFDFFKPSAATSTMCLQNILQTTRKENSLYCRVLALIPASDNWMKTRLTCDRIDEPKPKLSKTKPVRPIPSNWPLPKYKSWLICDLDKSLLFSKTCKEYSQPVGKDGQIVFFFNGSRGFRTSKHLYNPVNT